MSKAIYKDAFNTLCDDEKLGEGQYREVWNCRISDKLVVKVEQHQLYRTFHNVFEYNFWLDNKDDKSVSKWLAPCTYISPDGFILIQEKAEPLPKNYELPSKMPKFLTDLKRQNFGLIDGQLVCFDYAFTMNYPSIKMVKADWFES